jgi:sterol desaturase/sphingolipid hydroxylase (fatty acid hydroxylase superfamily)
MSLKDFLDHTFTDPVGYAVPVFLVAIGVELLLSAYHKRHQYVRSEALSSIGMGVGVVFVGLAMKALWFLLFAWLYLNVAPEAWRDWLSLSNPWAWVIGFFADDFSFYWHHRLSHSIRVLWASHETHHSSRTLNLATALRQSWGEQVYKYIFWAWMAAVGFSPLMILTLISLSLIYQFFQHTEWVGKLGPLEWVLNTPSHHRVHHATNIRYLDKNHAGVLIIWDRMFGTFQAEDPTTEPPTYGTRKEAYYTNLWKITVHEYADIWRDVRQARNWRDRLGYLFGPPGWKPGDLSETTAYLQRQARHR